MNKIYKVIWSKIKNCYVVTSEIAKSRSKAGRSLHRSTSCLLALGVLLTLCSGVVLPQMAWADPVINGSGTIHFYGNYSPEDVSSTGNVFGVSNTASGDYSTAFGILTTASGEKATAWGHSTTASGEGSTGWGAYTVASGDYSTTWGIRSVASGNYSTAWGTDAVASGQYSTAWNYGKASGESSTAWSFGEATGKDSTAWSNGKATAEDSTAWNQGEASAMYSVAWNHGEASGERSTAFNHGKAQGWGSTAWQYGTASGDRATAWGGLDSGGQYAGGTASGLASTAWGVETTASGSVSTVFGEENTADGYGSTSWGTRNTAEGFFSTAYGGGNTAEGYYSTASGYDNTASGDISMVFGQSNTASGATSAAWGFSSTASGDSSTAWGQYTNAAGYNTTTWGWVSEAYGVDSTAFGDGSKAYGENSLAALGGRTGISATWNDDWGEYETEGGANAVAIGFGAVSEGNSSVTFMSGHATEKAVRGMAWANGVADGENATAFGEGYAYGYNSTAWGAGNTAGGENSTAFGYGTAAYGFNATSFGGCTRAYGLNSTAFGCTTEAVGEQSTAFGQHTLAMGHNSTAFGVETKAFGENSTTFGDVSEAYGESSTAFGRNSKAYGDNSLAALGGTTGTDVHWDEELQKFVSEGGENAVAIGLNSQAQLDDSVALGSGAVANTAAGVVGYDPSGKLTEEEKAGATWTSTYNAIAVGDAANNITRQITGVAAGTEDTDAVNVAQLKAAIIESASESVSKHTVVTTDKIAAPEAGANGEYGNYTDGNIQLAQKNVDGQTTFDVKLNNKIDLTARGSVMTGDTTINNIGLTVGGNTYVTNEGINANNKVITNVAPGTADTDAVNVSQLKDYSASARTEVRAGQNVTSVVKTLDQTDGHDIYTVNVKDTTNKELKQSLNGTTLTTSITDTEGKTVENSVDLASITTEQGNRNTAMINKLDSKVNKVGARAAALAALHPLDFDPDDKLNFAAGYGHYRGENAAALGVFYRPDEKTMFHVSGTLANHDNMINAGVSFSLDRTARVTNTKTAMAKDILQLKAENAELKAQMAQMMNIINKLGLVKDYPVMEVEMFPDVPENHWAYEYIEGLQKAGIVEGYPDGNFSGDRSMTRYEFGAMLWRALKAGQVLPEKLAAEFKDEIGRFRVDRVHGADDKYHKYERIRVNGDPDFNRDAYGSVQGQPPTSRGPQDVYPNWKEVKK